MNVNWKGVFPAATTQFHRDLSLDLDATARHLEVLIDSGVSGLVMLGSLGENVSLTLEEKREVIRTALSASAGRVPVLSGVAELSTTAGLAWVRELEDLGAQGAMVMPAMAFRPDRDETLAHYRTIARGTSLPLIVYNNPISYHADVDSEMFAELAEERNLVAIKESSGDVRRITDIINAVGDRYVIFAGVDDLALECAMLGATGWIAGIGLAFPAENQYLWDLMMAGEWEKAREIYRWYTPLLHLDVGTKFVQNIKLAIQEVGLGAEHVRSPRLPLTGAARERVLGIIRKGLAERPKVPTAVASASSR
ncbi:dihydrodipicolinate synthase family protein [Fimbriimonas ginsengisoli]|uniref:Dihydrodipicolinate synthetase n=1 Tax=Fimbriimonas ginsengisoli Gsoil 348 TaxID=661478 RepID=A0A068NKT9_FIMGI|nr:dihydrodipicolinate synthase family protein [Fimbriimonas ginsengisoli]AIE84208.1 dihydrodipicolinate synthetase [Fimbriimonas ginsengisoli Gsoil 348]